MVGAWQGWRDPLGNKKKKHILRLPKEDFSLTWFGYSYKGCPQEVKFKNCQYLRCLVTESGCSHKGRRQDLCFFRFKTPLSASLCPFWVYSFRLPAEGGSLWCLGLLMVDLPQLSWFHPRSLSCHENQTCPHSCLLGQSPARGSSKKFLLS